MNMKFPRKVGSDWSLGQVIDCVVGRLDTGILEALGQQ